MRLAKIVEGRTTLVVPRESLDSRVPPTSPVFYNPMASTNRDISVVVVGATAGRTFCDAMASAGPRGIRIANEVRRRVEVTLVDINTEALRLARRNAKANGVSRKCTFVNEEANSFLYSTMGRKERFDYVDLDPFGTPAPYLQPLLNGVADSGMASVTATDTAVLCGVHPDVSRRRYGATPLNNEFHHETGVRILMNACRKQAAMLDLGVTPVAAHSTRHYLRVYFRVGVGASKADRSAANEGYIVVCQRCGYRSVAKESSRVCPSCGEKARCAGPLWVGSLTDPAVAAKAASEAGDHGFGEAEKILRALSKVDGFPPWSFSLERMCSALKVPTVPFDEVKESLAKAGHPCGVQPFEVLGVKTNASYKEVFRAVKQVSRHR